MPSKLEVISFCAYPEPTPGAPKPSGADTLAAIRLVKVLRGESAGAEASIPVPLPAGPRRRLDATSASAIPGWFGESVGAYMQGQPASAPPVFVPIPGARTVSAQEVRASRAFSMAEAAARAVAGATVAPLLWFDRAQPVVRGPSGRLSASTLLARLQVGTIQQPGAEYVLIDDLMSTGNHLIAAEAALRRKVNDLRVVRALCLAKVSRKEEPAPFQVRRDELTRLELVKAADLELYQEGEDLYYIG